MKAYGEHKCFPVASVYYWRKRVAMTPVSPSAEFMELTPFAAGDLATGLHFFCLRDRAGRRRKQLVPQFLFLDLVGFASVRFPRGAVQIDEHVTVLLFGS